MSTADDNPYDPPQSSVEQPTEHRADWKTWSPFQSEIVREICANMTPEEKSKNTKVGFLYGLWCAVTVALPLQFTLMSWAVGKFRFSYAVIVVVLLAIHVAAIRPFRRYQRKSLANTAWARGRGITAETPTLSRFGKR